MEKYKVSVITPLYNCEEYIEKTILSVQNQDYKNWEMILVDDCSTDNTYSIVNKIALNDPRIKLYKQEVNGGAAKARTRAMRAAKGRFIAYLDADDLWLPTKMSRQVEFMLKNKIGFSCTSYQVIDNSGKSLNKQVHMLQSVDYIGFLTNNLLQTVGIMVDTDIINKQYLVMPDIRRRQDAATWLKILKAGYKCYGLDEILAEYRRTTNSLSSNKFKAISGIWNLYRNIEHLSLPFSCYCFVRYAFLAVWKRLYVKKWRKQ